MITVQNKKLAILYFALIALLLTYFGPEKGFFVIIGLFVYFLPSLIFFRKKNADFWLFFIVNLLTGWTIVFWLLSLIISLEIIDVEFF